MAARMRRSNPRFDGTCAQNCSGAKQCRIKYSRIPDVYHMDAKLYKTCSAELRVTTTLVWHHSIDTRSHWRPEHTFCHHACAGDLCDALCLFLFSDIEHFSPTSKSVLVTLLLLYCLCPTGGSDGAAKKVGPKTKRAGYKIPKYV